MLGVDIAETGIRTPELGGRVYDRGVDGSEYQWGRVLAFEPPNRLVFSWDISPQWQIESDPEKTSEVEVRFIAESAERTRVEFEHRNLDRHGDGWESVREGVGGEGGWPLYLGRFGALIAEEDRPPGSRLSANDAVAQSAQRGRDRRGDRVISGHGAGANDQLGRDRVMDPGRCPSSISRRSSSKPRRPSSVKFCRTVVRGGVKNSP